MVDKIVDSRIHTVVHEGFLRKKGGDLQVEKVRKDGRTVYRAVKKRNVLKGGSREWKQRWFVLFDDGLLQYYAEGPPQGLRRTLSASGMGRTTSALTQAREFADASDMKGEVNLCVGGEPCRWFPAGVLEGAEAKTEILLSLPAGNKRSGMELQAVLEDDRHPDDPTGGWIAATKRFGASVVSLDLDDDMMMMTAAGAREESASNTLALWTVEDLGEWLATSMKLPSNSFVPGHSSRQCPHG